MDTSPDYLSTVDTIISRFVRDGVRVRHLSSQLLESAPAARETLGLLWNQGEPSAELLGKARAWGRTLHEQMTGCAGDDLSCLGSLRQLLGRLFNEGPAAFSAQTTIGTRLVRFRDSFSGFNTSLERVVDHLSLRRFEIDTAPDHLAATAALTEGLRIAWPKIRDWCSWQKIRCEALDTGLQPMVATVESAPADPTDLCGLFERSFRRALLFASLERDPVLRLFYGNEHGERIERFRKLDDQVAALSRRLIQARLAARIPRDQGLEDVPKAEIGLLRKELGKRTRHIPVRQLLARIPHLLPRLKPCVLMSPLSVAQYLDASHESFDVVVFDEASQIPVWDAVGAIARGKQLIVVGDPKQLPPTSFFAGAGDEDDETTPEEHKDLESILDELLTNGLRHKRLQWHYRSRHEGLIAFSNRQYYENDLLTFPSPEAALGGVSFRHLPDARYDKGKTRTNPVEAAALIAELVRRLRAEKGPARSFGIVTFSLAQQQLIENLLDKQRRQFPEIERHFGDEPPVEGEPVFVKNLENVQGDERDVILFSICYGPQTDGRVSMNFGPLNRDGGERRLNVAITRAKHEVIVFSGLRGDQIDLNRTRARGARDLKYFLEYAARGASALAASETITASSKVVSEFERSVAERLRAAGHIVHHQIGCSDYRIDLAVVDPANPGRYLLGLECDGATYHRAASARDRDKLRQQILEGLGWELHRIWSTNWWHDGEAEFNRLLGRLDEMRREKPNQP